VLGLTWKVRQMAIKGVFSFKAFKIISALSAVKERDLGDSVNARRHTGQYNRSLPALVRP